MKQKAIHLNHPNPKLVTTKVLVVANLKQKLHSRQIINWESQRINHNLFSRTVLNHHLPFSRTEFSINHHLPSTERERTLKALQLIR